MAVRFKQLSKTSTEWTSLNPTLLEGEIGFEKDTNKLKIGDGVSNWNTLEYVAESDSTTNSSLYLYNACTSNVIDGDNVRNITYNGSIDRRIYLPWIERTVNGFVIENIGYKNSASDTFHSSNLSISGSDDISIDASSSNGVRFKLSPTKKYLHRITLNLSDQASGSPPNKTAVIHLDYYSEQETAYTSPNFATLALTNSIGCSGYYIDADVSLTEKNFVYEIALPQSNEFILNNNVSITIQSTGSSITDEVIGYVLS